MGFALRHMKIAERQRAPWSKHHALSSTEREITAFLSEA